MNAAHQAYMNFELRLRFKYEMEQRGKFEIKFLKKGEEVQRKDKEITDLKSRLEDLEGDYVEVIRLLDQVFGLESLCVSLKSQTKGEDEMRKEFMTMHDAHANVIEDHDAEWVVGHGFCLDFMEYILNRVWIRSLVHTSLWPLRKGNVRVWRPESCMDSKNVATVKDLENVFFLLLDDLEACKDSAIEFLMASLNLEGKLNKGDSSGCCKGIETPLADAFVISNVTPLSSLAPNVDGATSIPDPSPSKLVSEIVADHSTLAVFVSQEPPIAVTDYEISDLNIVGTGVQNDNCRTVEGANTRSLKRAIPYGILPSESTPKNP
ncbi:hypothetical protein Tco_0958673 [Tanacetum coccineum]